MSQLKQQSGSCRGNISSDTIGSVLWWEAGEITLLLVGLGTGINNKGIWGDTVMPSVHYNLQ